MPKYLVELSDGKKFEVDAESPPSEDEVMSFISGSATAAPEDTGQGRLSSFASNVGRGAASIVPGVIGGAGYLTGIEGLKTAGTNIEKGINEMLPVNPAYEEEFLMKAGNALGQAGGMLATGGVTGLAGKSLAAARGLEGAAAAAKGTQLAGRALLGSGMLQGVRGGGQEAEKYGMEDGTAWARALLGGAIEGATEKYLFGLGTELAPVKKLLGDTLEKGAAGILRAGTIEGVEEGVSQFGGNLATGSMAPTGVETPGLLEDVPESMALGAVAGGALGGVSMAMGEPPSIEGEPVAPEVKLEQAVQDSVTAPDPIAPIQKATTEVAEQSVAQNADLLPATAAALGITTDETIPAAQPIPAGEEVAATTEVETPIEERPLGDQAEGADSLNVVQEQGSIPPDAQSFPQTPQEASVNETPVETETVAGIPITEPTVKESLSVEGQALEPTVATTDTLPTTEQSSVVEPSTLPLPTGIKNAITDAERIQRGLPPIETPADGTYSQDALMQDAERERQADPQKANRLITRLKTNGGTITDLETAILTIEKVDRVAAYNRAVENLLNATPEQKELARQEKLAADDALSELDAINKQAGTEQGRSLAARKIDLEADYSVANMDKRLSGAFERPLEESELREVKKTSDQIIKAEKDLEEHQNSPDAEADAEAIHQKLREKIKAEILAEQEAKKLIQQEVAAAKKKAKAENKKSFWEDLEKAAMARRKERRSRFNSGSVVLLAVDTADLVLIGAARLARGITKFADWASSMSTDFADLSQSELERIYAESEKLVESEGGTKATKPTADERIAANAAEGKPLDPRFVYQKVEEKVRAEPNRDLTSIIKAVTADIQKSYPDVTERQVRDLFSGYGKVQFPSQEEAEKALRELSALAKKTSALEDIEAGKSPLRSGPQRDEPTLRIREASKLINRRMKELGIPPAPSNRALKTPLDATKSRLRNRIEELTKQIADGKRTPNTKKGVELDDEAKALESQRNDLQEALDAMDVPQPPTAQELIEQRLKNLDAEIADLQKRVAERNFAPPQQNVTPITEKIQVKVDERDTLKARLDEIQLEVEGEPTLSQEEINEMVERQLEREIRKVEQQIADQDFAPKDGPKAEATPEITRLRLKLEGLREQRAELKEKVLGKKRKSEADLADAAVKALEKSIDKLNEQIQDGDIGTKGRTSRTPETAKIKNLRAERDSLRGEITRLRKAKEDAAKDPVAEKLKADRKLIQRQIDAYQKRLDSGDYRPRQKKAKEYDKALLEKQVELTKLKEEWSKRVFEAQLSIRPPWKKLGDSVGQVLNTSRAILTSFDLSGVLRQGGFITIGNPLRAAANIIPMLQAFKSEQSEKESLQKLKNRDNWSLYQRSKLYIAETDKTRMSAQEEAFMSRWIDKIPKGAKGLFIGSFVRGSQRSYITFLNNLRADTFDAMLNSLQKGAAPTQQEIDSIATYINVATGRGELGKLLSQAAVPLNTVFFAPRLVASRFQIIAGYPLFKASGRTKALVLREYGKFLLGASIAYSLGMLAQDDEDEPLELDPRSSDFMKLRFGDTRVDFLSGLIQATVLVSRIATNETKNSKGKIMTLGPDAGFGQKDFSAVVGTFLRSKFSPAMSGLWDLRAGKNIVGETQTPTDVATRMIIPMSFPEAMETLEAQGVPKGTALTILMIFGAGVQTYQARK